MTALGERCGLRVTCSARRSERCKFHNIIHSYRKTLQAQIQNSMDEAGCLRLGFATRFFYTRWYLEVFMFPITDTTCLQIDIEMHVHTDIKTTDPRVKLYTDECSGIHQVPMMVPCFPRNRIILIRAEFPTVCLSVVTMSTKPQRLSFTATSFFGISFLIRLIWKFLSYLLLEVTDSFHNFPFGNEENKEKRLKNDCLK